MIKAVLLALLVTSPLLVAIAFALPVNEDPAKILVKLYRKKAYHIKKASKYYRKKNYAKAELQDDIIRMLTRQIQLREDAYMPRNNKGTSNDM